MWELCPRPAVLCKYRRTCTAPSNLQDCIDFHSRTGTSTAWSLTRTSSTRQRKSVDLELYQAEFWAKYSGAVDYGQLHHFDYGNHTLVVPKRASTHVQLAAFIMLSDVSADAPTYVVSTKSARDTPLVPRTQTSSAFASQKLPLPAPQAVYFSTNRTHCIAAQISLSPVGPDSLYSSTFSRAVGAGQAGQLGPERRCLSRGPKPWFA